MANLRAILISSATLLLVLAGCSNKSVDYPAPTPPVYSAVPSLFPPIDAVMANYCRDLARLGDILDRVDTGNSKVAARQIFSVTVSLRADDDRLRAYEETLAAIGDTGGADALSGLLDLTNPLQKNLNEPASRPAQMLQDMAAATKAINDYLNTANMTGC